MKKSTLFFKVMVLMALLVPWTAWGQTNVSTQSTYSLSDQEIWEKLSEKKEFNFSVQEGESITAKDLKIALATEGFSEYHFVLDFDDSEGKLPAGISASLVGQNNDILKFSGTATQDGNYSRRYLIVKSGGWTIDWDWRIWILQLIWHWLTGQGYVEGDAGYITVNFNVAPAQTDITDPDEGISISIDDAVVGGTSSKTYDGEPIAISVTDKEGKLLTMGEDYVVKVDDVEVDALPSDVKDNSGAYSIVIVGKGDYSGETLPTNVTISPKGIQIKATEDPFTANVGETMVLTKGNFTLVNENPVAKDGVVLSDDISITLPTDNATTNGEVVGNAENLPITGTDDEYKAKNYNVIYPTIHYTVTENKFDEDNINVSFDVEGEQIGKVYNGEPIPAVKVTPKEGGEPLVENEDYTVSYGEGITTAPKNAGNYTVTITGKGKYAATSIIKEFTIEKRPLKVVSIENTVVMLWDKETGEAILTPSSYLTFEAGRTDEGFVKGESATFIGELSYEATETGYVLNRNTVDLQAGKNTNLNNYTVDWGTLTADGEGISAGEGDKPETHEGEAIYIKPEGGEVGSEINLKETKKLTYDGKVYEITKLGDQDLSQITDVDIAITYNSVLLDLKNGGQIRNAGEYEISISYKKDGDTYVGNQTLVIKKAPLTVTVLPKEVTVTEPTNPLPINLDIVIGENAEAENATVTVGEVMANDVITFAEGCKLTVPEEYSLGVNENAISATVESLILAGESQTNYEVKEVVPANLTVYYQIDDPTTEIFVYFDAAVSEDKKVYDGEPVYVDWVETGYGKLDSEDYDVTYIGAKENDPEHADADVYTVTVTLKNEYYKPANGEAVSWTGTCEITPRPIVLYFSFGNGDNTIKEDESLVFGKNVFVEVAEESENNMGFADGEEAAEFDELIEKGIISAKFALGETQSDGTVEVQLVSFNYPAGEVPGYDLKYSNYDPKLLTGHVKEHGEGGTETELPDAGEAGEDGTIDYPGEGGSEIIVGDVDIIDEETGIGGSGINYRQYELKFCETDFFPNLNDYEVEGLKLFSRHNRFYTKANGSFTIWYEKDGVKNGEYGDYRIYISRNGADGDYSELKLDEVSDYFQIRNVNSDIWVRIYYGTGFPVANEEITATDARAYAQANKIVVITPEPTDVQVISMAGAVVATDQVTGQREFANLAEGVYIVRMGETVIKLQVRN